MIKHNLFECINPDYLLQISDSDIVFLQRIFDAYNLQMVDLIRNMQISIQNNDVVFLSKLIHKLQSSFTILGISQCNEIFDLQENDKLKTLKSKELQAIIKKIDVIYCLSKKEMTIFIHNLK